MTDAARSDEQPGLTLRVTSGGKIHACVARALDGLKTPHSSIRIEATGNAVCKAVSVAEITRRRLRGLHQSTKIGFAAPKADGVKVPTISLLLSLEPLDALQPGCALSENAQRSKASVLANALCLHPLSSTQRHRYQAPLTEAELCAAWIIDPMEGMVDDAMAAGISGEVEDRTLGEAMDTDDLRQAHPRKRARRRTRASKGSVATRLAGSQGQEAPNRSDGDACGHDSAISDQMDDFVALS